MKTNFRKIKSKNHEEKNDDSAQEQSKDVTAAEFEEFILKSGAKGSFMIYRSNKKDDELGLDEL